MNNSKGISVISVIVTVIIIIMMSSITIFSGTNMLRSARESKAKERLEVIFEALVKEEDTLGIGDTSEERVLQDDDYIKMGLDYYAKGDEMPEVVFSKRIGGIDDTSDENKRTYHLKTYIDSSKNKSFEIDKEINVVNAKYSTDVLFDVSAGVNRPQLTSDMIAVNFSKSEIGEYVTDVYGETWYNYNSKSPNYANAEMKFTNDVTGKTETITYVWIPRFAYKIQDYYAENVMPTVPDSAIDIKFLKGTTNTCANGETISSEYKVHPAFTFGNTELAGIWVEKYAKETSDSISEVYADALNYYNTEKANSHLMKNSEYAAIAYLAQTCNSANASSTTSNFSGIFDVCTSITEYTATYVYYDGSITLNSNGSNLLNAEDKYKNEYAKAETTGTFNDANVDVYGDALVETSSGKNEHSAWYNSQTEEISSEKPFIARGYGTMFGYVSTDGEEENAQYRTVIIVNE